MYIYIYIECIAITAPPIQKAKTEGTTKSVLANCSVSCLDLLKCGGFLQLRFYWGVRDD